MKPVSDLQRQARWHMSRHYYGDGRWGEPDTNTGQWSHDDGWTVVKKRPLGLVWARSTGRNGWKVHAIRYALSATHSDGETAQLTVWWCGGMSWSETEAVLRPKKVCLLCTVKYDGATETTL